MAWQPKGNCFAFYESSISVYAPEASGVYGLYNFDYQLYIGESANVRAALLQHLGAIDCQPARYQPTGFSFEVCPRELRVLKAEKLMAEHKPVRQTDWPCAESWDGDAERQEEVPYVFNPPPAQPLDDLIQEVLAGETPPVVHKRFYFARGQVAMLTIMFVVSLSVIFFLGILTGESIQKKAGVGNEALLAGFSAPAVVDRVAEKPSGVAEQKPQRQVNVAVPAVSKLPPKSDVDNLPIQSSRPTAAAVPGKKIPVSAPVAATVGDNYLSLATAAEKPKPSAPRISAREPAWAVQLAANREKTVAEAQVAKLKAKGYDSYTVETERDGQTWYRVRVGRFTTRVEAEALREVLASRESYRDPFVTTD